AVLESVQAAHRELEKEVVRADYATSYVIRHFGLPQSPLVDAFVRFVEGWHAKAIVETGSPSEFLEYLDYFVQAHGSISLPRSPDDAVQLLTAHAAKGLEFRHVAVVRGSSTWFPCSYKEPLVAFPAELRRSGSLTGDDKTLHEQEERRLFYVAMTRAKDSLHIYGKQGIGRDKTPAGLMRELIGNAALHPYLRSRPALPSQPELIEIA